MGYEVYIAHESGSELIMQFSKVAADDFFSNLQANQHALDELISRVDVRDAKASVQEDRSIILKCIEESVGYEDFNSFIQGKLRSSLAMIAMRKWMLSGRAL